MTRKGFLAELVKEHEADILKEWLNEQFAATTLRKDLLSEAELAHQSKTFLKTFQEALQHGDVRDIEAPEWSQTLGFLRELSRSRANHGFTPSETATFVFSLKQPLFSLVQKAFGQDVEAVGAGIWAANVALDKLGVFTLETFIGSREALIKRQQDEMLELSTPVVKIWDQIVAVPLIGTLDSARSQVVMENLLQEIVTASASVAIIDITGVPAVDTLVAQHLIKTVSAARLMGVDCVISGIRPQIAQTMVHLGVTFSDIVTKSSLADAIKYAFAKIGLKIAKTGATI